MEKIRQLFHNIAQFFTSLFEITAYAENQKKTNETLSKISEKLEALHAGQVCYAGKLDDLRTETSNQMKEIKSEVGVLKEGLQVELFESLQQLHDRLQAKRWASVEEKQDAKRYYD